MKEIGKEEEEHIIKHSALWTNLILYLHSDSYSK